MRESRIISFKNLEINRILNEIYISYENKKKVLRKYNILYNDEIFKEEDRHLKKKV